MAVLAVNIGNTNIHLAIESVDGIKRSTIALLDEAFDLKLQIAIHAFNDENQLTKAIVSSVNPVYTKNVVEIMKRLITVDVNVLNHESNWSVDYHLYEDDKLGIDRMLVCEATYQRQILPAIIFDFGTATTMNVVDGKGVFLGGAIFPGVHMGLEALNEKTALLPEIILDQENPNIIGTSTSEAMRSAAIYGNVAMVEGMVKKVEQEVGQSLKVYITGGASPLMQPHFSIDVTYAKDLILEGILSMNK